MFVSNSLGLVYFLTKYEGALRLLVLTKLHHDEMTMSGAVVTATERPNHFEPAASPIFLKKTGSDTSHDLANLIGLIKPTDDDYQDMKKILGQVETNMACIMTSSASVGRINET